MIKSLVIIVIFAAVVDQAICAQRCVTPDSKQGECISLSSCPKILELTHRRPLWPHDREFLRASQCGWSAGAALVCCEQASAPVPAYSPVQTTSSRKGLLPEPGECGIQESDRIFYGGLTKLDEFPWMALIQYRSSYGQKTFACGGSLISPRYVLTAAHCINVGDWELFSVRLGEWDLESDIDCYEGKCADAPIDVPVEKKIRHEQYNPKDANTHHDIALLRLSRNVKYTDFIRPVCLPSDPKLKAGVKFYEGEKFDVSGWGKTEHGYKSQYKLAVDVPVVSKESCGSAYRNNRITITDKQICAGGGIKDSCGGDSGGPMMAREKTSEGIPYMYVLGLVSYGPEKCGTVGTPGVYTRVSEYIDWIKAKIQP